MIRPDLDVWQLQQHEVVERGVREESTGTPAGRRARKGSMVYAGRWAGRRASGQGGGQAGRQAGG